MGEGVEGLEAGALEAVLVACVDCVACTGAVDDRAGVGVGATRQGVATRWEGFWLLFSSFLTFGCDASFLGDAPRRSRAMEASIFCEAPLLAPLAFGVGPGRTTNPGVTSAPRVPWDFFISAKLRIFCASWCMVW